VDDTLRVSLALPTTPVDFRATGTNHTWDFRSLTPVSQNVNRFTSMGSTSFLYQLVFGINPNQATIASPVTIPDYLKELASNLSSVEISNPILFYQESESAFQEVGFGATVAGVSAPVKYKQPDIIYQFPLTLGSKDSAVAFFEVDYAALQAYYAQTRKRVNHVDGWGTLSTPFGTFPVLRVVSTLSVSDTLRTAQIDPVRTIRPVIKEYKWLGKDQGVPLLQINTMRVNGQEEVVSITYRDIYRNLGSPLSAPEDLAPPLSAYPSPLGSANALTLQFPALRGPAYLTLFHTNGQLVYRQNLGAAAGAGTTQIPAAAFGAGKGLYLLRIEAGKTVWVKKILRD
jgi:hypothetical protein